MNLLPRTEVMCILCLFLSGRETVVIVAGKTHQTDCLSAFRKCYLGHPAGNESIYEMLTDLG